MPNRCRVVLGGNVRTASICLLLAWMNIIPTWKAAAQDKELKGFSFIEKVISSGEEPVYQVDGYLVQILAGTDKEFRGKVDSLADVSPGVWLRFVGTRGSDGTVMAERAGFYPDKLAVKKPGQPQKQSVAPDTDSLIDAQGNIKPLHSKVRISDSGGWCGWHRIPREDEQQARVRRIGNRLLPTYLRQMAEGQLLPQFRFFVVEEKVIRSELACNPGLVLVPDAILDRLTSDDQLAAILADGIAYNVQYLRARLIARDGWLTAAQVAELATWAVNPIAGLAANGAVGLAAHEHNVEMELERGRLALSMMADAGFDPRQAPEAWKLLGPKHLPKYSSSLKYPRIAQYQLMILEAQYKRRSAAAEQQAVARSSEPAE